MDPATGHLFLTSGSEIKEYDVSGSTEANLLSRVSLASAASGVAVDGATGNVYVSRLGESHIEIWGPAEPQPPIIEEGSEANLAVGATEATLGARVNPEGASLSFHVDYVDRHSFETEGGFSSPHTESTPEQATGFEDSAFHSLTENLTGLEPHTAYVWRLVATNACSGPCGTTDGEAVNLFTRPPSEASALPDDRGYEMVSPPEKNSADVGRPSGGTIFFSVVPRRAADSGAAVTYASGGAFGGAAGAPMLSQYLSRRGPSGWSTENLNPDFEDGYFRDPLVGFSPDLAHAATINLTPPLTADASAEFQNLYVRDNGTGSLTALTTEPPTPEVAGGVEYCVSFGGASDDFSHVYFAAKGALLGGAEGEEAADGFNLYEWTPGGGVKLASVLPDGSPATPNFNTGFGNHGERFCNMEGAILRHAVSADASRAFWTYQSASEANESQAIYVLAGAGKFTLTFYATNGRGTTASGSTTVTGVTTTAGAFAVGEPIVGPGIPDGATIASVGAGTLTLSAAATASGTVSLSAGPVSTTPGLNFGASAAEVQSALNGLASISAGGGSVTVVGGPGSPTGSSPYLVTFDGGPLAGSDVAELVAASASAPNELSGGSPFSTAIAAPVSLNGGLFQTAPGEFAKRPLLARVGGSETVQIDANQGGSAKLEPFSGVGGFPEGGQGEYWDASTDGSKVFFTDSLPLTEASGLGANHLYMYDFERPEGERLVDLTPNGGAAAEVQGVLGASEKGDYVYFVAEGALTPESDENEHEEHAEAGEPNLYAWHDGESLRFVAKLAPKVTSAETGDSEEWSSEPIKQSARVAPDGRHLAFLSLRSLTGYENTISGASSCERTTDGTLFGSPRCPEAFVYDFGAESLSCASCDPSGARPTVVRPYYRYLSGRQLPPLVGWQAPYEQPHNLSANGKRLVFGTQNPLVAHDENGVRDVYEWHAPGEGSCSEDSSAYSPVNGGCVSLLSTGESGDESYFVDASTSGDDVFISTSQHLSWRDSDGHYDVYDARVGGEEAPPPPPASCEGEGCRGADSSAGSAANAGTAAFSGPGNPPRFRSCKPAARRAQKLSSRAKRLRRNAKQVARHGRRDLGGRLNRKARRYAKTARRHSKNAKRCRRANRRASR